MGNINNCRMDTAAGSLRLKPEISGANYLLLHSDGAKAIPGDQSPDDLQIMMEEWGSGYQRINDACHSGGYPEPVETGSAIDSRQIPSESSQPPLSVNPAF